MKLKKILFFFFLLILIINVSTVKAENKKTYKHGAENLSFVLDKDTCVANEVDSNYMQCTITEFNIQTVSWGVWEYLEADVPAIYFFPYSVDTAITNSDKWWWTLYVCRSITHYAFRTTFSQKIAVYTDSFLSEYIADSGGFWNEFFGGSDTKCLTYEVQDVAETNLISSCSVYLNYNSQINDLMTKYESTKNSIYRQKYKGILDKIENSCKQSLQSADYNDACVQNCLTYHEDKAEWDEVFYPNSSSGGECGLTQRVLGFLENYLLKGIRYIVPAIVILMGIVDFMRAFSTDKEDGMKKAQSRFIRRLIAAALIFLVPYILEFIIEKMGFVPEGCGVIDL